jgi:hypothetical protein
MPRPPAREVAEMTGAAAMMSTATTARESRRRSRTAERAANHSLSLSLSLSLQQAQILGAGLRLLGQRSQEADGPRLDLPRASLSSVFAPVSSGADEVQQPASLPIERKCRPQWRAFAIALELGTGRRARRRAEANPPRSPAAWQRRIRSPRFGPHRAGQTSAAARAHGGRRGSIHAKPHTFNDGGQVPRVDDPPVMAACRRTASRRMRQSQAGSSGCLVSSASSRAMTPDARSSAPAISVKRVSPPAEWRDVVRREECLQL